MVRTVQTRFPNHRFRRMGEVEGHHDRIRFRWDLAPEDGPALVTGTDFAVIAGDRLKSVTGFFDTVPQAGS